MIPLSIPHLAGNEWKYVKDCLDTGWVSSVGAYVTQFEKMVAKFAGANYGIACMNGTAALHIGQILLGVEKDDHVITPNITFVATLNAIKYTGAKPILIDVNPTNWQMDLEVFEQFLEQETYLEKINIDGDSQFFSHYKKTKKPIKAIMPVHVLGNIGDMDRLVSICKKYHIGIIEDSTEALGSYYKGRHAGTFGKIGTFSFNGNKIISTGGGGVIVTDDEALAKRAKHITTTAKASPMEYFHDETGYNYRLVNILAAVGVAQMEQLPDFILNKKAMDAFYRKELDGVGDIQFQEVSKNVDPNCWLFTFRTKRMRELLTFLNENGVQSRPFWVPMNRLPMHGGYDFISNNDQSNEVYESALSIPSSSGLTQEQLQTVVDTIKSFYN